MKGLSTHLLLVYPALRRPRRPAALRAARTRLREGKIEIDQVLQKLAATLDALPAPSPREYERMAAGEIPVTPEALLAGALKAVVYSLEEASEDIEGYFEHTPADLRKGFVDPRLLRHLDVLVKERNRP